MFTYWVNAQISGDNPYSYHVVNVLLHCATSGLVFLIVRRLCGCQEIGEPRRTLLAAFAAALFLLHPAQTEAVAYLAGRSEALSVCSCSRHSRFFSTAARRPYPGAWPRLCWFSSAAALLTKEHTVVLPALLLLTDYWWNPGFSFDGHPQRTGAVPADRRSARLPAIAWFLPYHAARAKRAGFGMKDCTWYQYFFTQCRALFVYIGMFLLPVRLNADWDFPISRTVLDHGAIFGLVALVGLTWRRGISAAAFRWHATASSCSWC